MPTLEDLYQITFGEEPQTEIITFDDNFQVEGLFTVRIDDAELFSDRESLKKIVTRRRLRFPFLKACTITSANHGWGNSIIIFRNEKNTGIDEFSEDRLVLQDGAFAVPPEKSGELELFPPKEALSSVASSYPGGGNYAISPVAESSLSEFSIHYLALFLLSSLVRYRPQTWMHALSRSVMAEAPADDQAISLIERFLELNSSTIPAMIAGILNPPQGDYA